MTLQQWVNLPKEDTWVGDGIGSQERLGELRVRFTFEKTNLLAKATYELVPLDGNAAYSDREKRHPRFATVGETGSRRGAVGSLALEAKITLPAAGGNRYKIVARCKDTEQESAEIETRRRLYYKSVTMAGVAPGDLATFQQAFSNPDKKYFIELVRKDDGDEIPAEEMIDITRFQDFIAKIEAKTRLSQHGRYGFALVWVRRLVMRQTEGVDDDVFSLTLPPKDTALDDVVHRVVIPTEHSFYKAMARTKEGEQDVQMWLEKLECEVETEDGKRQAIFVPLAQIKRVEAEVEVRLKSADLDAFRTAAERAIKLHFAAKVYVEVTVNGLQVPGRPIVLMATEGPQGRKSNDELHSTLVHEVGHALGMVARGGPGLPMQPDVHAQHYENNGHRGPHCKTPAAGQSLTYDAGEKKWTGSPGCVMFGSSKVGDNVKPATFCDACGAQVRKLDLHPSSLYL